MTEVLQHPRRLTPGEITRIKRQFAAGVPIRHIAKQHHLSEERIKELAKK